jgi:hypothetical protein
MEFRTRSLSQVLGDLVAKLKALPLTHPDRPTLTRMVIDLRREIERRTVAAPAARRLLIRAQSSDVGSRSTPGRPYRADQRRSPSSRWVAQYHASAACAGLPGGAKP